MADSAAHLVDEVLPKRPIRQWVLSVPFPLRYLFATNPQVMSHVLTIVHRVIGTFLIKRARMTVRSGAQSGAVTLIQRFGSALNLNPHFHMLYLNGVYDAMGAIVGASITYRLAFGPNAGRKALTLQTVPVRTE